METKRKKQCVCNRCGTRHQGGSARLAKRSGTGPKGTIRTALTIRITTSVEIGKTDKVNMKWKSQSKKSFRKRHVLRHSSKLCVSDPQNFYRCEDDGTSEKGRPTKEGIHKKRQEYQESKQCDREDFSSWGTGEGSSR